MLYLKCWRGIKIDATLGSMDSFNRIRPEYKNWEVTVSDMMELLTLSIVKEGALNTFDSVLANRYMTGGSVLNGIVMLETRPLAVIFEKHLLAGQKMT
jgi:hypothetical protein